MVVLAAVELEAEPYAFGVAVDVRLPGHCWVDPDWFAVVGIFVGGWLPLCVSSLTSVLRTECPVPPEVRVSGGGLRLKKTFAQIVCLVGFGQ